MKFLKSLGLVLLFVVCFVCGKFIYINNQVVNDLADFKSNRYLLKSQYLYVKDFKKMDNPFNSSYDKIYKVNNYVDLYSLSFKPIDLKVNGKLAYKGSVSDQLYVIFRYSYPYVSLDTSLEKLYQARQLAIWNIASRTDEANVKDNDSFDDMVSSLGNVSDDVLDMASNYVSSAANIDSNTLLTPSFTLTDEDIHWEKKNGYRIMGPFVYETVNTNDEEVSLRLSSGSDDIPVVVVSSNGERITLENKKEFYLLFDSYYSDIDLDINLKHKRLAPSIYEDENRNDYLVCTYEEEEKTISKRYKITESSNDDEGKITSQKL